MESLTGTNALRELFDELFFFSAIYLIPFTLFVLLFQIACIIWSPFAALICGVIARKTGLSVWKYALAGAICSTLLFVPWVFLIQRMRNRKISYNEIFNPIYFGLYTTWIALIFGNIIIHRFILEMSGLLPAWLSGSGIRYEGEDPLLEFWQMLRSVIVSTVIGVPILIPSLIVFIRRFQAKGTGPAHIKADTLFQFAYLVPFVGTSATIIPLLWFYGGIAI